MMLLANHHQLNSCLKDIDWGRVEPPPSVLACHQQQEGRPRPILQFHNRMMVEKSTVKNRKKELQPIRISLITNQSKSKWTKAVSQSVSFLLAHFNFKCLLFLGKKNKGHGFTAISKFTEEAVVTKNGEFSSATTTTTHIISQFRERKLKS